MNAIGMRKGLIRHLAVPLKGSDIFAAAEFEQRVTLWSFAARAKLAEFDTVLDFGGNRLALAANANVLLVAARFSGPLEVYGSGGDLLWSRKDLFGIQHLTQLSGRGPLALGVGREHGPYVILNALDGTNIRIVHDTSRIFGNPYSVEVLHVTAHRSVYLATLDSGPSWERSLTSFAVIHAAFSPTEVVYSEAAGPVHCFQLGGQKKWEINPEQGRHFIRVAWNHATGTWMAIDWNYENGGSKLLLEITDKGTACPIADLGEPAEIEFFGGGDYLATSNGDILVTRSAEVVWRFADPRACELS